MGKGRQPQGVYAAFWVEKLRDLTLAIVRLPLSSSLSSKNGASRRYGVSACLSRLFSLPSRNQQSSCNLAAVGKHTCSARRLRGPTAVQKQCQHLLSARCRHCAALPVTLSLVRGCMQPVPPTKQECMCGSGSVVSLHFGTLVQLKRSNPSIRQQPFEAYCSAFSVKLVAPRRRPALGACSY